MLLPLARPRGTGRRRKRVLVRPPPPAAFGPLPQATEITMNSLVGRDLRAGAETLAPVVNQMLGGRLERFRGRPAGAAPVPAR